MSEFNVIIAGVGGQGILTIAALIARAAINKGMQVKQSEVHGMSQRGGAVQAHVRIAQHPIHSELIPMGKADLIIAVEPLESLRYLEYLNRESGVVVTSSAPMRNIDDYPPLERVLADIARSAPRHVIVDAPAIARQAGTPKSENVAILGAASRALPFQRQELLDAIRAAFAGKGEKVVESNVRAFELGCKAANTTPEPRTRRAQLFEHEVYQLLESTGKISPPRHRFVPRGEPITEELTSQFCGDRIVVKVVSSKATHKSDSGGVRVVARFVAAIEEAASEILAAHDAAEGVLLVEFVEHPSTIGGELFVGLRGSREFGPLIVAGLGGVQTEYLASRLPADRAVAIAPAMEVSAAEFFELFSQTCAGELLAGRVRGITEHVDRATLTTCFEAFIQLARSQPDLSELEVNPFAVTQGKLVPLDGRGQRAMAPCAAATRAEENVRRLLQPRSIAVMGVSAQRSNFGRIILNNTQAGGFPPEQLFVIKDGVDRIDGIRCLPALADVPKPLDLLVAAVAADQVPNLMDEIVHQGEAIGSVIVISGGLGETSDSTDAPAALRRKIAEARKANAGAPVFVGPNSMGIVSRPGAYDTFFIPPGRLEMNRDGVANRLALISQSGAFMISRMSNFRWLHPAICVSLGNQLDVTFGDTTRAIGERDDIDCIGVYVEGFNDLDGLEFMRAVKRATRAGKTVVFYKAGRTDAGRSAAQGHTASLAGDWNACCAAMRLAGALVATSLGEFERLVELGTQLHRKTIAGARIAAVSNAGCETVGMADNDPSLPALSPATTSRLGSVLAAHHLAALVTIRNPLDVTPMASDAVYGQCVEAIIADVQVDAVVVGCVPMSSQLLTLPDQIECSESIAQRIVDLSGRFEKPIVAVFDCGPPYDALIDRVRRRGVPVFRHVDEAIQSLRKYLAHRSSANVA